MSFVLSRNDVPEASKYALKDRVVQIIGRGSLRDMSFVLSRNDVPEASKYALKDRVVQIIGRGSLRDCNDPRISREHASLTTEGETLTLRALHLKPCFYRKSFSDVTSILSRGESVELCHGDFFGLLPETNWYELIYIKKEDAENNKDKAEAQNKNKLPVQNDTKNYEQSSPAKRPHTPDQDPGAKKVKTEPESPMMERTVPTSNIEVGKKQITTENCNVGSSQALTPDEGNANNNCGEEPMDVTEKDDQHDNDITNADSLDLNDTVDSDVVNEAGDQNTEDQSGRVDTATNSSNDDVKVSKDATSNSPDLNNPTESDVDAHSSADEIVVLKKVIKSEPDSSTTESVAPLLTSSVTNTGNNGTSGRNDLHGSDTDVPSSGSEMDLKKEPGLFGADDVKKEPQSPDTAQPGTSKDQPGQAGPSNDGAAPAPPNVPPRERCLYGTRCYRKNVQHKAQFSHPGDADYGAGERAQCPYGAQCHRTDPRHWTSHLHPDGTLPPQRNRNGIRVVQRRGQFFYINAHSVHFHDNHYAVEDEDGQRVDYDYEF